MVDSRVIKKLNLVDVDNLLNLILINPCKATMLFFSVLDEHIQAAHSTVNFGR